MPSIRVLSYLILVFIDLAFCQTPLTTTYSSSGFTILHSTARFHSIDSKTKDLSLLPTTESSSSSSFPSQTSLSSLSTAKIIGNLTSLLTTSKDRLSLITMEQNPSTITTNVRSLSTAPTLLSNVTSLETSILMTTDGTLRLLLLLGCISLGLVLLLLMIYAILRYRNRDEGTYKIDESHNFVNSTYLDHSSKFSTTPNHREKHFVHSTTPNLSDSREWYV